MLSKVIIEIEIPEHLRGTEREQRLLARIERHAIEQAVLELYEAREISTGTGAKMLGLPLYDFILLLSQHGLSIFPSSDEEVAAEMQNVERERQRLAQKRESQ